MIKHTPHVTRECRDVRWYRTVHSKATQLASTSGIIMSCSMLPDICAWRVVKAQRCV